MAPFSFRYLVGARGFNSLNPTMPVVVVAPINTILPGRADYRYVHASEQIPPAYRSNSPQTYPDL